MTDDELKCLLDDLESDRVERKESMSDSRKICQAICAFANDMSGHGQPGVLFIGEKDGGGSANLPITDDLLTRLAGLRGNGNILPFPVMSVQKQTLNGHDLAVVVVQPSSAPPVRYNGRTWIRVGPRRDTATVEEERRLSEKRRAGDLPHDLMPVREASLDDLDHDLFQRTYLPSAVDADVLRENHRSLAHQMAALRFTTVGESPRPTVVGLLASGFSPASFIPGGYIQFLRIDGLDLADPIMDQREIHGPLPELLRRLDDIMKANIRMATDVRSAATEIRSPDYPIRALEQLVRNAVMHRDYHTSHAPVRVYWYQDRIEIQNPGGPFGQVTMNNFAQPGITDYRNPNIAEAMKNLGYVQRFGMGIPLAQKDLRDNGNPAPEFVVQPGHVLTIIRKRP